MENFSTFVLFAIVMWKNPLPINYCSAHLIYVVKFCYKYSELGNILVCDSSSFHSHIFIGSASEKEMNEKNGDYRNCIHHPWRFALGYHSPCDDSGGYWRRRKRTMAAYCRRCFDSFSFSRHSCRIRTSLSHSCIYLQKS